MSNKHLVPRKTTLFKNKLSKTLENLTRARGETDLQTKEAYVLEAVKLVSSFYKQISEASFDPIQVRSGTAPILDDYNENLQTAKDDLDVAFAELENLEGVVIEHFNLTAAHANRLNARVKRLASRVNDFALFSKLPVKNSLFFSDSFADLSKTEPGSSLLNATECSVNQVEGIVTLPINTGSTVSLSIDTTPVINSNSNGRAGNNEEVGATVNSNISTIFDNNPDTWYEYERVTRVDDQVPLTFDFTVNLAGEEIINFVRINPNNFGTKTEIEVVDISTSTDGQLYVSIKDDIPITGFLTEDEENVFRLAPSTSKYAGQGLYTFTPRYAKYIRVVLKQSTPYIIQTVQGPQFRYAVGVRDLEVQRQAYEAAGEIVSNPFEVDDEVRKVAIRTSQNPATTSELAEINHQVSFDDGNTWHDISPLDDDGLINVDTTRPEILNVDTEDENAIITSRPATTVRYKAILKREDSAFDESASSLTEQRVSSTEMKAVPQGATDGKWVITLDNPPVDGSVSVIDPTFGSKGKDSVPFLLGRGDGTARRFYIPFDIWEQQKVENNTGQQEDVKPYLSQSTPQIKVFVAGEEWTRDKRISGPSYEDPKPNDPSLLATDKVWNVTRLPGTLDEWVLSFGDGTDGKAPPTDATIEIRLPAERLYPLSKNNHIAELDLRTYRDVSSEIDGVQTTAELALPNDKALVTITRIGTESVNTSFAAAEGQIHRLGHRNVVDGSVVFVPSGVLFTNEQTFSNGLTSDQGGELEALGDYSIDYSRGIVYSYGRTTPGTPVSIQYRHTTQVDLSIEDWDWADEGPLHKKILIKDRAWVTNPYNGFNQTVSGMWSIPLPKKAVIEGSVKITAPAGVSEEDNPLKEEVPYLDGWTELTAEVRREDILGRIDIVGTGEQTVIVPFKTDITNDTDRGVIFSDISIFATEQGSSGAVTTLGDYYVDRANNQVYVRVNQTIEDGGTVVYYSESSTEIPSGAYSIDYENGNIYLSKVLPADSYSVDFEYCDYRIKYNIARKVDDVNVEVDGGAKTVSILPKEVEKKSRMTGLLGSSTFAPNVYQINYEYIGAVRQSIQDLAPYFSPILRDYALQVITKEFI